MHPLEVRTPSETCQSDKQEWKAAGIDGSRDD